MKVELNLSGAHTVELQSAILIYSGSNPEPDHPRSQPYGLATSHRIELINGVPTIQPGAPVTAEDVGNLSKSLSAKFTSYDVIPDNLLFQSPDKMIWWMPAQRRQIFFKCSLEKDPMQRFNSRTIQYPPLLFMTSPQRTIHVFALPSNQRPTSTTPLYRAPLYNIYEDGTLCHAGMRTPEFMVKNINAIAEAFYDSFFTHSNFKGKTVTTHPKGWTGLYQLLTAKTTKRFPTRYLVKLPLTIKKLINVKKHD